MEKLVLQDNTAELHLPNASVRKLPAGEVMKTIGFHTLNGMTEDPLPESVRWSVHCGPVSVFIVELKPEVRSISWISKGSNEPMGPKADYENFRLATPFIILKVPFLNGKIHPSCELFYRTESVTGSSVANGERGKARGLDSEIYWCNLLNVSPNAHGCIAWFCTQYLSFEIMKSQRQGRDLSMVAQLDALVTHIFGGGFNFSSEHNEGKSCFTQAAKDHKIDPRVTDVERWQEATTENPRFVLDVEWKPVGMTVRDLLTRQLEASGLPIDLSDVPELINTLLAKKEG